MNKSLIALLVMIQAGVFFSVDPHIDSDHPERVVVDGKSRHENRQNVSPTSASDNDNAEMPPCWSLNDAGDAWEGTCDDVRELCGGSMTIAKEVLNGVEPQEGMKFSYGGGDGFPREKAECHEYDEAEEDLDAAVAEAFERLPLPVPVVVSEPEGLSLVNLENYVRGVVNDFDTTVELLDQRVRITAYPVVWSWDMGDGTTYERTAGSGGFPDGGVLHPFYRVGEYDMSVTVTWAGHYQVEDSNTWLPVNGQGHTTSEPEHLAIEERRAYLGTPPDEPDE